MNMRNTFRQWIGAIVTVAVVPIFGLVIQGADQARKSDLPARADLITLNAIQSFGPLERPPVVFSHEKHLAVAEKNGKDCSFCHLTEKEGNRISYKFRRLQDTDKEALMKFYHTQCMACHLETKSAEQKTGPLECGQCHRDKQSSVSSRQPAGMDQSLHYRHVKASENKCDPCHHAYNPQEKKLFYAKGQEGTCRYCHKNKPEENRIAMEQAGHLACIACHRQLQAQKKEAGPIKCSGCHDAKQQQSIKRIADPPRIDRKQPTALWVKTGRPESAKPDTAARMNPVPFNHQAHETYTRDCRTCHHESLQACHTCHTESGAKEGNFIKLEQAMHRNGSNKSCLGCHAIEKQNAECAGCHAALLKEPRADSGYCRTCHLDPLPGGTNPAALKDNPALAAKMLEARRTVKGTYGDEEIPEKVQIKILSEQYQAVEFPHRRIVKALAQKTFDRPLAAYFHESPATICQSCHHNSPAGQKPPNCFTCHGAPFDRLNPLRPGLKAAYHRQCMDCHTVMALKKPDSRDCTVCHKEKTK